MGSHQPMVAAEALLEGEVATQLAYLALARRLRQERQRVCGLWPVPADLPFTEVPRHLARAMASLGVRVGLVAPRARWRDDPAAPPLSVAASGDGVDFLTPAATRRAKAPSILQQTLNKVSDRYDCVLLDLSGLDVEDAPEVASLPGVGVALFAAAGRSSRLALARMRRRLPAEHIMGAVLVDAEDGRPPKSTPRRLPSARSSAPGNRRRPKAQRLGGLADQGTGDPSP